jgi:XisI protein
MAKLDEYRQHIQEILTAYSEIRSANEEVEAQTIFDIQHDHYQLVHAGWSNKRRIYGCILHLDLKNDKIWIQHDGTEDGVANELLARGVPSHDIVLAFHSPFKRQFTEFAVS